MNLSVNLAAPIRAGRMGGRSVLNFDLFPAVAGVSFISMKTSGELEKPVL
jgi:hypothetical protein